jgi:hypothetical protein
VQYGNEGDPSKCHQQDFIFSPNDETPIELT